MKTRWIALGALTVLLAAAPAPAPLPAPRAAEAGQARSLVGNWSGRVSWKPGIHRWTFFADGSFTEPEGHGRWTQNGAQVSWRYTGGTVYRGYIDGYRLIGRRNHPRKGPGTFTLRREP